MCYGNDLTLKFINVVELCRCMGVCLFCTLCCVKGKDIEFLIYLHIRIFIIIYICIPFYKKISNYNAKRIDSYKLLFLKENN